MSRFMKWERDRFALTAAVLGPLAVSVALVPLRTDFPSAGAVLLLVVAVVAVAANGHRIAGLLAAASAAVCFDFFLTVPYERLAITHRADVETTLLLLAVGAAVTELAARGRQQRRLRIADAAYLAAIRATTELVAAGQTPPAAIVDQVRVQLTGMLGLRGCRFERSVRRYPLSLQSDGRLIRDDISWDVDEYGMPDYEVGVLATCGGRSYGQFVLQPTPGVVPSLEARQVAVMLAGQAGTALAHLSVPGALIEPPLTPRLRG
jgi:uncharacterized protein DUF4118